MRSLRRRTLLTAAALCGAAAFSSWAAPLQAASADGRWQLTAEGEALSLRDGDGSVRRHYRGAALDGSTPSAAAALYAVAARRSFVVVFERLPELWEISLDPQAEPIHDGLVHDYQMGEAIAKPGFLGVRRTRLERPLHELTFDSSGSFVLGRAAADGPGPTVLHLVQLDVRRVIGRFTLSGQPDLAAAQALRQDGRDLIVVPDRLGAAPLSVDVRAARRHAP